MLELDRAHVAVRPARANPHKAKEGAQEEELHVARAAMQYLAPDLGVRMLSPLCAIVPHSPGDCLLAELAVLEAAIVRADEAQVRDILIFLD